MNKSTNGFILLRKYLKLLITVANHTPFYFADLGGGNYINELQFLVLLFGKSFIKMIFFSLKSLIALDVSNIQQKLRADFMERAINFSLLTLRRILNLKCTSTR